jgi:uncharacterized metal-binding protein/rhodanese-related sulfurtransferase
MCRTKGCRKASPCSDKSSEYIDQYTSDETRAVTGAASKLVDNGRAGTLSRLEEIVEYCKLRGYSKIGVAYCFGMEKEAELLKQFLNRENLALEMISCSVDGVKESTIDSSKVSTSVSCNPIGQAARINAAGVPFTILMGLCLGHDVIIQKKLNMEFTTLIVKDRVNNHNPMAGLTSAIPPEDLFIKSISAGFHLIDTAAFAALLSNGKAPGSVYLLDMRSKESFEKDGIEGSINCTIQELPEQYRTLLPRIGQKTVVYCNGGIQSVYAVMFLKIKGYKEVYSLTGGYSKYLEKTK